MKNTIISIGIVALFLGLASYPAIAQDIYNTEVRQGLYTIPWGNGLDDNGDGVIDDWGEADVQNGTKEIDPDNTTGRTFYTNFTYPNSRPEGVMFDAYIDEIFEVYSNENISLTPDQSCYFTNTTAAYENYSAYGTVDNVLNVVTFYMNLTPGDVMNGAQEMWYRSPLVWNDTDNTYEEHYLNVYNEDNELVYASQEYDYRSVRPKFAYDGSELDGVGGQRVYYKMNFNFRTQKKYRFEEYVTIEDDNPINSVKLYMARGQDIGQDGLTDTYIFKGKSNARKIPMEASWSMVCTVGIGRAGTEGVMFGHSDPDYNETIFTSRFSGSEDIDDVGSATFIFPMRTTKALHVVVSVRVWSGGDVTGWQSIGPLNENDANINNVTGTIIFSTNITDPNASAPNEYQLFFTFRNLDEDNAVLYSMYPSVGSAHTRQKWNGETEETVYHFATHQEIASESASSLATGTDTASTPDLTTLLIGVGLVIAGVILTAFVITSTLGVPLIIAGVAAGATITFIGSQAIIAGLEGESITEFASDLAGGLIRASRGIIEGVSSVAGGLYQFAVQGWEFLKDLGSAAMYWGGLILDAVAEVIWLIAFLVVIWIWSRFLDVMKQITLGNPEGALKSIATSTTAATRATKRVARPVKRTAKKTGTAAKKTKRWYDNRKGGN